MKRLWVLFLVVLLLSGCGKEERVPAETVQSTSVPEQTTADANGDVELKVLKAVLTDGKHLTLSAVEKQEESMGRYGIREIRVFQGEQWIQTVEMMEAIEKDGVDGIDLGYTDCFSLEDAVKLKDVDFDGNPDLEVFGWSPNNAVPYYYWLWNPEAERYEYAFMLQLRDVDTENRELIAWYKVENGLYHTDYYRVTEEKKLELLRREVDDIR